MDFFSIEDFLAKNKYPEVKRELVTIPTQNSSKFENISQLENRSAAKSPEDYLILSLYFAGWGPAEHQNFKKAEHWINQAPMTIQLLQVIMLLIIHLRNSRMTYRVFLEKYQHVLEKLRNIDLSLQPEIGYRILRLLAGWVQDHCEHQLAHDLNQLSEWIDQDILDTLQVDQLIDRWTYTNRKLELHLLSWVIGTDNQKLEYLIGTHHKKNLTLVRKLK